MARKGKSGSKKSGDKGTLISFVITVVIIVIILYSLETLRQRVPALADIEDGAPVVTEVSPADPKTRDNKSGDANSEVTTATTSPALPKVEPRKGLSPAQARYSSPAPIPSRPRPKKRQNVRIAIIVDDMGGHLKEVESLVAIGIPITFAVIPSLPHAADVARHAHATGYEVMLHIPMEPKDYPNRRIEDNGLLLSLADGEIERRISSYIRAVPYADGANNHMGSRFTEDKAKMRVVLSVLGKRGLFFIDSKTSSASVGERLAGDLGLKKGRRDVFLDNVQEPAAIKKQLEELVTYSRKHGGGIGICHPHPATIKSLETFMPILQAEGVKFVRASEMVN